MEAWLTHFNPVYASFRPFGNGCSGASLSAGVQRMTPQGLTDSMYKPVVDCDDCQLQINAEWSQDKVIQFKTPEHEAYGRCR